MNRRLMAIVLLVSLAHATVHTWELTFGAIEESLQEQWGLDAEQVGWIGWCWALPFGLGALPAGLLADRIGCRRVLIAYLFGGGLTCVAVGLATSVSLLVVAMFCMGGAASLYHPAGLAYISRTVPPRELGAALGLHGIVGSVGIAGAPILAESLQRLFGWQPVYLFLSLLGFGLAALFLLLLPADPHAPKPTPSKEQEPEEEATEEPEGRFEVPDAAEDARTKPPGLPWWVPFGGLCVTLTLFGMMYRGLVTFLPRYLGAEGTSSAEMGGYWAGLVLAAGIAGQYLGAWMCSRLKLEWLLLVALIANIPPLLWMGVATGPMRIVAAIALAVAHFMMQPIGNSLIAQYTPLHRRSLGYGFSFLLSFGLGSLGAPYAGWLTERFGVHAIYPGLAVLAGLGVMLASVLAWASTRNGRTAR